MRTCPMTEFLGRWKDRGQELASHLTRCESCRTTWEAMHVLPVGATGEEACPEPESFVRFGAGRALQQEREVILNHAMNCWWCSEKLRHIAASISSAADFVATLHQADIELAAFEVAADVASHLARLVTPTKLNTILKSLENSFVIGVASPSPPSEGESLPLAAFAPRVGQTIPQRIVALARIVGELRLAHQYSDAAIAEYLDKHTSHLTMYNLSGDLLALAVAYLRAREH